MTVNKVLVVAQVGPGDADTLIVPESQAFQVFTGLLRPDTMSSISGGSVGCSAAEAPLLFESLFKILQEKGQIDLKLSIADADSKSLAKMVGFREIEVQESDGTLRFKACKGEVKQGGPAKIKRKNKKPEAAEEANPWANLGSEEAPLINEDELMNDANAATTAKKFCGDGDKMQGAKPCANCTCGLKE